MAYDLEEQEKLDALKDAWNRYGNLAVGALAIVVIGFSGMQWWNYHQHKQAAEAASLFGTLQTAQQANQPKRVKDTAAALIDKYAGTAYAARAALISASSNSQAGDVTSAQAQLQWVLDNSKENGMKQLAALRLAALLIDQKKAADAIKLLDAPHDEAFAARFADLKGDALMQQNQPAQARASYTIALEKLDAQSPFRKYIEVKLDALGGETK
jgi:predicted negative regulator of RcsB-dependent stress response